MLKRILESPPLALVLLAALIAPTACGGIEPIEPDEQLGVIQQAGMEPSPFRVREDLRTCLPPLCGGLLVSLDGRASTTCADGTVVSDTSCYVAALDWGALMLRPDEQTILEARARAGQLILTGLMSADLQTKLGNVGKLVITNYQPSGDTWFPDVHGWYPDVNGWRVARTGY